MAFHGITSQVCSNFHLFSLGEINENYSTPVTSIIAMSFVGTEFHHLMKTFTVVNFKSQSLNSIDLLIL